MSDPIESRRPEGAAIVRVAGGLALPVRLARGICGGSLSVSVVCLVSSARSTHPSSVFQSFAIPAAVGALTGVMMLGVMLSREKSGGPLTLAELLAKLGSLVFAGVTLYRFLPHGMSGGWWSAIGGALMTLGLALLVELLKYGSTATPETSASNASSNDE